MPGNPQIRDRRPRRGGLSVLAVMGRTRPRARLTGVASYVPERVLTNAELETMVDTTDEWIRERTGISERHIAADNQATSDLALAAAQALLRSTRTSAADIDLLIIATTTPDHIFPPTATLVADQLGATSAAALDINAVCSGFVYGLAHATGMVESGLARKVMVIGAETLSRIVDWNDRSTCVLFADGAGAALIEADDEGEPGSGVIGFELGADGSGKDILCIPAGGSRRPARSEGVEPADLCIQMAGREVFRFATRIMVESATRLLQEAGLTTDDVDLLVAHQANKRILQHAAEKLEIPPDKVVINIDRFGNTSSASIPIALAEAVERGNVSPGDLLLMVGFGAGLTWGAALVRWEPRA